MTLEDRVKYWRGRARVAMDVGLADEAATAKLIAGKLHEVVKMIDRTDKEVDVLASDMPQELAGID